MAELIGIAGEKKGFLPTSNSIPFLPRVMVQDLNTISDLAGSGMSLIYLTAATANRPKENTVGICIHLQRIQADHSASQIVSQVVLYPNKLYFRSGYGTGETISWYEWREL